MDTLSRIKQLAAKEISMRPRTGPECGGGYCREVTPCRSAASALLLHSTISCST
jgi:hypothetical protein